MKILKDFEIEVREDYESFIAEVPEIPGCAASGLTASEAIENLKVAIAELDLN